MAGLSGSLRPVESYSLKSYLSKTALVRTVGITLVLGQKIPVSNRSANIRCPEIHDPLERTIALSIGGIGEYIIGDKPYIVKHQKGKILWV